MKGGCGSRIPEIASCVPLPSGSVVGGFGGVVGPVGELGFELLDGREGTLELGGEGLGDAEVRDADRFVDVAQGVLDDEAVRAAAEEEADGGASPGVRRRSSTAEQ